MAKLPARRLNAFQANNAARMKNEYLSNAILSKDPYSPAPKPIKFDYVPLSDYLSTPDDLRAPIDRNLTTKRKVHKFDYNKYLKQCRTTERSVGED